jgi:exodeoxyribonuclease VII large subunit
MAYERTNAALTVSQLNNYIKTLFESDDVLCQIAVRGEISNFKNHYSTGHLYFSLKDSESLIRCVMFSSYASRLTFAPDNGMTVTLYGRVSLYPRDGSYQIYVSNMIPDGIGDQHIAFEMLKRKLEAEGLFDQSRKKPLPKFPSSVGVVTSATGAAIRDILNVLSRRYPVAEVLIYPALVQGDGAANSVANGIKYFNRSKNPPDVIIIGRGGGSGEDLFTLSEQGHRVIDGLEDSLLKSIRDQAYKSALSLIDFRKSGRRMEYSTGKSSDGKPVFTCSVTDNRGILLSISASLETEDQLDRVVYNWGKRPESIYRAILGVLNGDVNYIL